MGERWRPFTSRATVVDLLTRTGVSDPESWADSELGEDIPQVARAILLHRLWPGTIDRLAADLSWIDEAIAEPERDADASFGDAGAALPAALSAGVTREQIGSIARHVAYMAVFDTLCRIDEGDDEELDDGPSWLLMEVDHATGEMTGRDLKGLHEEILGLDPSGREGRTS